VSGNVSPPPPGSNGTYYLGAVVDPGNSRVELIEDNNTHSGYVLGVGSLPDFVITAVTGPDSVASGQSFKAQVTVCNQGTQPGNSNVTVLLSRDELIGVPGPSGDSDDAYVGRDVVGTLTPGQCTTVPVNGAVYPPDFRGAYYLGARVDPVNGGFELNSANNTSSGYRVGVGSLPDFVVTAVTGPDSVAKGATFTASFTVCNRGQLAQAANVNVYLSADGTIRVPAPSQPPEDYLLASVAGINLSVGACVNRSVSVTLPPALEGGYTLGAVADPANLRPESIEDNNTLAGSRLGVGDAPDFAVTDVTSVEMTVNPGMILPIDTTLCNRGRLGGAVDVDLYLFASPATAGTQAPASPEAYVLGRTPGVSLAARACVTHPLLGTVPALVPEGTYFLGAVVDPLKVRTELIEDNNVLTGSRIAVGVGPELIVAGVIGPASVRLGATFTATVDVCNRGLVPATTDVDLFLSADTTVRLPTPPRAPEDFFLGTVPRVTLAAGTCVSRSLPVRANVPSTGGYYVGAAVDPRFTIAEFFEDNNTLAFGFISVTP
jgi:subtilase family serine protease